MNTNATDTDESPNWQTESRLPNRQDLAKGGARVDDDILPDVNVPGPRGIAAGAIGAGSLALPKILNSVGGSTASGSIGLPLPNLPALALASPQGRQVAQDVRNSTKTTGSRTLSVKADVTVENQRDEQRIAEEVRREVENELRRNFSSGTTRV